MMWAGPWKRPWAYSDKPEDEVRAVHESLGVIDVSTLGKILVEGPEAAELLERLYPNRFTDLRPGRIRYGVLTTDGGRIMDDGTIARLADDLYYVTTTSTGADAVTAWFEWWNAVWGYEAEIVNVTGALAALNLAGPRAREALQKLVEDPEEVGPDELRYLDAKQLEVAGVPCLALRIGFVGELGYELHFPSPAGEFLWDTLVAGGARPFGLEPQRVLRLEKGHIIVGQDTDSESNLLNANMHWLPKLDKDDFVGKFAVEHFGEREERERLVGFTMEDDVVPDEGAQIVIEGRPAGRVTSARRSEAVGAVIGLAWLPPERSAGRHALRGPRRPAHARRARDLGRRSTTRAGSGCAREHARLPLAVALRGGDDRVAAARARSSPTPATAARSRSLARPLARRQARAARRPRPRRAAGGRGARPALASARLPSHPARPRRRRRALPRAGRPRVRRDRRSGPGSRSRASGSCGA